MRRKVIMPYWKQAGLRYNTDEQEIMEMRVPPAALTVFCEAAYQLPYTSGETATFIRSLRLWLRRNAKYQWEVVNLTGWREAFCECWSLLHHTPFTKSLPCEVVQELRAAFGDTIGGYWQSRFLPRDWDRDADRFAPQQAQMAL